MLCLSIASRQRLPPRPARDASPRTRSQTSSTTTLILTVTSDANSSTSDPPQFSLPSYHSSRRVSFFTALLSRAARTSAKLHVSAARITPLLTRNFLDDFPPERTPHALHFVEGPRELARLGRVRKRWGALVDADERKGESLCVIYEVGV